MNIIGDKSKCANCNTEIVCDGQTWHHTDTLWDYHKPVPEHSIQSLEGKLSGFKREVTYLQQALREKNILLDRLHNLWCTGPCSSFHRWTDTPLTEKEVEWAERYARDLRYKFEYLKGKNSPKVSNELPTP